MSPQIGQQKLLLLLDSALAAKEIQSELVKAGLKVVLISDPDQAETLLEEGGFRFFVAQVHLVADRGNPLLRGIEKAHPELRVILLAEFARLSETKYAADQGYDEIVPLPAAPAEIRRRILSALHQAEPVELPEANYARIGVEDFIYGRAIDFPIYVRLRSGKFIRVADRGENFDLDQIDELKSRGLTELWLERRDFENYAKRQQEATETAIRSQAALPKVGGSDPRLARLVRNSCELAAENLRLMGVSSSTLQPARDVLMKALRVFGSHQGTLNLLEAFEQRGSQSYTHAVSCGIVCGILSQVIGWTQHKNILALTLGGFLHDVGLNELPVDMYRHGEFQMSEQQRELYELHPRAGADLLAKIPDIAPEIITIVLQHHENRRGTGFPQQLPEKKIFPMAGIVSLVDRFCEAILNVEPQQRSRAPEILERIVSEEGQLYDDGAVLALKFLLGEPDLTRAKTSYEWAVARRLRVG